jgi:hypothetical protein
MTALELDSRMDPEDDVADAEVAAQGLESESEALAFAEQVQPLRVPCMKHGSYISASAFTINDATPCCMAGKMSKRVFMRTNL